MTKEEIIAIVQECTARLGHAPTRAEFLGLKKVTGREVRKNFGTFTRMLAASGVERQGSGYPIPARSLFLEWAQVVRSLGRIPTVVEYQRQSKYSVQPLFTRFGSWRNVPPGMLRIAWEEGLESEWKDVLDIIALHQQRRAKPPGTSRATSATLALANPTSISLASSPPAPRRLPGRPAYGRPLPHSPLSYAPTNEAGVLLLFGSMARELGFVIMRAQAEFPDCEAMREIEPDYWQTVRIEFEYESRGFVRHMHSLADCDLIVCWSHNWPECPLEVLELQSLVRASKISA